MNHCFKTSHPALKFFAVLILLVSASCAKAQKNIITFDVGDLAVTVLPEGQHQGNKDILIGATEEMLKQTIPDGTYPSAVNVFLVEVGDKTILFDAGFGRKLFDNIKEYGKTAADIDAVLITHMHGDHIEGLLVDQKKSFPKAELYIPKAEYDYWMNDEAMQDATGRVLERFALARRVVEAYKDKIQLFVPGTIDEVHELFPGIRTVAAYGHTPGHTGYMLESNGSKLFIWGDLVHAMAIQMPFPEVAVIFDVDPVKAVETRLKLLEYLSDNEIRIAGAHVQFPGLGDIRKNKSNGYDFMLLCDCKGR